MKKFYLWVLLLCPLSVAEVGESTKVCVRNFLKMGLNPCAMDPDRFAFVPKAVDPTDLACTRRYADFHCDVAGEYVWLRDAYDKPFCALNYAQPPLANFCESVPDLYDYV